MTDQTSSANARGQDIWKVVPGFLVSLIALTILFVLVDWREFISALQQADYRYLLISLPIYMVSYLVRARAWQVVLLKEPLLKQVFLAQQAGYLLNNILPFRLGELGRAYLLGRSGLGFWRVFSTIFVERAFDILLAVGLLFSTLPFIVAIPDAWQVAGIVGFVILLGLLAMYLLARKQTDILQMFEKLGERWPHLVELGRDRLQSFLTGFSALADFSRFIEAFGWMALSWLLAVIVQYLVLKAYIPEAQVLWAASALSVVALGMAIPASPGQIGVYEGAFVYALSFYGVSPSMAFAYALTIHGMHYLFTGIFGTYALVKEGESLGQLFRRLRETKSKA